MKLIKALLSSIISMLATFFILFFIFVLKDNTTTVNNVPVEENIVEIEQVEISSINSQPSMQEGTMERITEEKPQIVINSNKFYYSNLNDYSKLIYNGLNKQREKLKSGNDNIVISNGFGKAIENGENIENIFSAAVNAFEYDNPDLFYIDFSKFILYYERSSNGNYSIYLKNDSGDNYLLSEFADKQEVISAQNEINNVVNGIKENLNNMEDDYSKILYIHDWLIENIKYDETISKPNKDNIYGAFVKGEAVCGGYAKAFKYLLDMVNINTIIVQGIGTAQGQTENHAWNYVQLNDEWYGIDCTWDDPVIIGDISNYTEKKYYTYFLKGRDVFKNDHDPFEYCYGTDLELNYPSLSETDYQ